MSGTKRVALKQVKSLKNQIETLLKKEPSREILSTFSSAVDQLCLVNERLETIAAAEIDKIVPANKTPQEIEEEEDVIFGEIAFVRDLYTLYSGKLNTLLAKTTPQASSTVLSQSLLGNSTNVGSSGPRLPKISIPDFSGDIREFQNWKNLFVNLVHDNPDISTIQKLYYLKSVLKGDASALIRDLELSERSYAETWKHILDRFENRRVVIRTYFSDLLAIQPIKSEHEIRSLLDKTNTIVRGLRINGEDVQAMYSFLAFFVATKLDKITRRDWENSIVDNSKHPSYSQLEKFLANRSFSVEDHHVPKPKVEKADKVDGTKQVKNFDRKATFVNVDQKCVMCNGAHELRTCQQFLSHSTFDRFKLAKANRLCINCLQSGHIVSECKSGNCHHCNLHHHSLLHHNSQKQLNTNPNQPTNSPHSQPIHVSPTPTPSTSTSSSVPSNSLPNSSISTNANSQVTLSTLLEKSQFMILPSAVVRVVVGLHWVRARILLDSCSQPTLISESFVRKHNLSVTNAYSQVHGLGNSVQSSHFTNLTLVSRYGMEKLTITADVIPEIPFNISKSVIADASLQFASYKLKFAEMDTPFIGVDIIIGVQHHERCFYDEHRFVGDLCIRSSKFRWVILGPLQDNSSNSFANSSFMNLYNIEDNLQKFWQIEELPQDSSTTSEHDLCVQHFRETMVRNSCGQFVVCLPFKIDRLEIGYSRSHALASLKRMERSLDSEIRLQYIEFMREYESLSHMEKILPSSLPNLHFGSYSYYIPHRVVLRPSSSTTKLRVIFNASAKSSSSISLNDALMIGPNVQPELFDTLLRF